MSRKSKQKTKVFQGNNGALGSIDGLPVYDAEFDLRVTVLEPDTKGASRGDPANCVLAKACRRQFGTQSMAFNRTNAYVEVTDEEGNHRYERFILDSAAKRLIAAFDRGGDPADGIGRSFVLRKPLPSQTLEAARKKQRAYDQRQREAALRGETTSTGRTHKKSDLKHVDLQVRNGQGMVQMKKVSA